MLDKQNDPISIEKKIKISLIDYSKLNKIKEDFGKRFVTQKELSAEQTFWLKHSSFSETPVTSHTHVRIESPSELPKRITSNVITAGAWGFKHTKACFVAEIILFLKVLKDTFNAFDRTLLDEITEVQTIFNQMEAVVDQCSSQEKDTVIRKLKDRIKSLSGKDSLENVKKDIDEIETINIELEHNLNAQLQEKVFANTALKNELRKLKGKNVVDTAVSKPNATITPGMFKLDIEPMLGLKDYLVKGLEAIRSKKTQKTLLRKQYENFNGTSSEGLDQTYDSLQKLISQLEILVNDKYKTGEGYHAVLPPYTGNFMPPKPNLVLADEEEYVFSESITSVLAVETSKVKTSESKPKYVVEPLIEDWISNSEDENETEFKSKQRNPSFAKVKFVKSNVHVKPH
ncbi:hypothetical protein Tco_0697071 [Tanacetum coccineum]